jgi:hypothetical protein
VAWSGLSLNPGAHLYATLAVTVGQVASGTLITNSDYGAWCMLAPVPVHGAPSEVRVTVPYRVYLPLVMRELVITR